jgi:glycosyltransferase involved in cell wall biosynthesis
MKLGILVGEEKWTFFREISEDLAAHFQTDIYERKKYNSPILYDRINHWAYRKGMRDMLRRNDVCFFEWASELLMVATHMPKECAIVTRLHSFELYKWAPTINWDAVDRVILVSKAMQELFLDEYPGQNHKTAVIYNGTSLETFKPVVRSNNQLRLGMLCAINPVKRIYEVVLALAELRERGFEGRLHIAGEPKGDYRYLVALVRTVERLDLQDNVSFDGFIIDTPTWLQNIDIFISNSYWEGQQVALLEAMASGCYCLSHFWDGAEEVLPAEYIYNTDSDLQRKIINYCQMTGGEKAEHRSRMRCLAEEKFDISRIKVQIRHVIEEVGANKTWKSTIRQ